MGLDGGEGSVDPGSLARALAAHVCEAVQIAPVHFESDLGQCFVN